MVDTKKLEDIAQKLEDVNFDIKIEVLLAELIKNFPELKNHFLITNKGQFTRNYRRDILQTSTHNFDTTVLPYLLIELSRDGFYDMLPEGVFHYPTASEVRQDVADMTREYKKKKKEEQEARVFFTPFENEFLFNFNKPF